MKKCILYIAFLLVHIVTIAQVPGTWSEYFSFRNVQQLEAVDDNVFALSENGIFIYNTTTEEMQKVTKLTGLSTVGLTCFAFCDSTSSFLIGYSDGTLDILYYPSLRVKSIPTIAQKSLYASKKINKIVMQNDTAIIAAEFGVLTFSMTTNKFISTTILSSDGSYVPAKSIACGNNRIYSATTKGIYSALLNSSNLSDYNSWSKLTDIPYENDTISHIVAINESIYYVHKNTADASKDSIFKIVNGKAEAFKMQKGDIKCVSTKDNNLLVVSTGDASIYASEEKLVYSSKMKNGDFDAHFTDIIKKDASIWIADYSSGLINGETFNVICPQGPQSNLIADLYVSQRNLHIVEGVNTKYRYGMYDKKTVNNAWYGHTNWSVKNSYKIYAVPNSETYYYGTFGWGLVECENFWTHKVIYNQQNSIIQNYYYGTNVDVIGGITSDRYGNIWFTNPGSSAPIVVMTNNKELYSYNVEKGNSQNLYTNILVDKRGYKWIVGQNDVIVFYENKTLEDPSDDDMVRISLVDNEGTIASTSTCIVEDLNGEIWIGTNQGIAVHSAPSRVFKDRKSISRIKIEIDGEVGYLLSSENITCIAVDGANRKWIGTENSGVFLISENGTEQLENFTKSNSSLPTNNTTSIAIDQISGEVYIGTAEGLVSYIGDATVGNSLMDEIKIFPNPVRESYEGDIYIQDLVADANIKITDISGNLVRTIIANGGTATWNGRNLYGDRVQTGVYLIYISDETATYTTVKKILFIN